MGGIYPTRTTHDNYSMPGGGEAWIEDEHTPGLIRRRQVFATEWVEIRTDCFCCSCPDDVRIDVACRNHGYYAKRPCEKHGMDGYAWEDTDEMPESVQKERERLRVSRLEIERDGA